MIRSLLLTLLWAAVPAAGDVVRLTWMHSDAPAASVDVKLDDDAIVRTSDDGTVEVAGAKTIRVFDPESGLQLLEHSLRGETSLRVPESVRIRGRARRVRGRLTAKVGDGPYGEAVHRMQRELGALVMRPFQSPLGIAAQDTPLRWTHATVDGLQFTSGWIVADPSPQLLLFDERGHAAVRVISIPSGVRPRSTIDAGTISLEAPAVLEVTVPAATGDTAPSIELHVQDGIVGDHAAASRELAVLDQRDRRLFALLAMGEPYYLPANGRGRLLMPPWLRRATIVVRDSYDESAITRDVSFRPGTTSRVELTAFAVQNPMSLGGVVVSVGDPARVVPYATVVVADGTRRRETKTDAAGRFRFDGITAPAPVPLFVDSHDGNDRQTAAFHVRPALDLQLALPSVRTATALPKLPARAMSIQDCNVEDDQYPVIVLASGSPDATFDPLTLDWESGTMTIVSNTPGSFVFHVYATPFLLLKASFVVPAFTPATAPLEFTQPENITFLIQSNLGFNLPEGLEVSFSPPPEIAEWVDATEIDLDSNSSLGAPCVNFLPLSIFIDDENGRGCDGELLGLTGPSCTIFLPSDPTQPCACLSGPR